MPVRGRRRLARSVGRAAVLAALAVAVVAGSADAGEEPEYPHGKFEGDCETCHADTGWTPARVRPEFRKDHRFPLKGAHALDDCRACHRVLDFTEASAACVDCHLDPHRGELGIDCAACHVPRTFLDRTRMQRAHQATRFPLRGTHRALDCEDCHTLQPAGALRWVNTPGECVDCHRAAYEGNAQHVADGFPLECDRCHAPTVWEAGRFDHSGIVDGCVACHLDDYQNTTDPNHADAGFPTTCENCHSTRTFDDAEFDHPFPIYSGAHAGRWDSCSTCHVNPSNLSDFSCFGCHPHSDEARTRSDHSEVSGFEYVSRECYACHPDGRH